MRIDLTPQPITDDDDAIRAAVACADIHPLLTATAQATGDYALLRDDFRPNPSMALQENGGLSADKIAEARDVVTAALIRFRDGGSEPAPPPDDDQLRQMIAFLVGPSTEEYLPVLREELDLEGNDLRRPAWTKDTVAPDTTFRVAIVGAGMSGIAAAHRLAQAGVPFVVFEKNADVGGTWLENTYPGCRVDVPNHLYSYSFAQTPDWPQFFSSQDVLLDYFRSCADHFGLREHIRFSTEVLSAEFDEDRQLWRVRTRSAGEQEEQHEFEAIVSAVGQLNRPSFPNIDGRDRFEGPSFHSAEWDHSVDLTGKRVAVIGTGASALQFIPIVAEHAAELLVFQRTAPWLAPSPNYQDDLPSGLRWVLRHVPAYARWDRLWLFWRTHEGLLPMAVVDPSFDGGERAVSAANDMVRQMLTAYLRVQFSDDELFAKVVPDYPPIAKRVIRDNGIWARTLARENVELITDRIDSISEKGIVMAGGQEHVVDVIIYGTGFQASRFLTPMQIMGRGGVDIHERWHGDARAYLGITVPEFPNLFLMYGPNTNIVINGSIIYFSECEARYIVESIRMLLERGSRSMECKPDVHDAFNERIDTANRGMAWGASKVNSWYKNEYGRSAQNWPFSLLEYWQQTRGPNPDDYVLR